MVPKSNKEIYSRRDHNNYKSNWKEKMEKFNLPNQVNTLCECKEGVDGLKFVKILKRIINHTLGGSRYYNLETYSPTYTLFCVPLAKNGTKIGLVY